MTLLILWPLLVLIAVAVLPLGLASRLVLVLGKTLIRAFGCGCVLLFSALLIIGFAIFEIGVTLKSTWQKL